MKSGNYVSRIMAPISYPIAGLFAIFTSYYLFNLKSCSELPFLCKYYPTLWNFDEKITFIYSSIIIVAITLFLSSSLASLVGIFTTTESQLEYVMNRAVKNTLEQSFAFLPLFGFWVLKVSNEETKHLAISFILLFTISRVLYCFGYFFLWLTDLFIIRSSGFACSLACNSILIAYLFGFNPLKIN